jgi:hypothetical protein
MPLFQILYFPYFSHSSALENASGKTLTGNGVSEYLILIPKLVEKAFKVSLKNMV